MSFSSRISVAVTLVLAVGLPAFAQITSSIHGVVRDANSAVLPGATVTVESPALRRSNVTVVSDEEGRFRVGGLQAGTYTVKVELQGFADAVLLGIELGLNTDVPLNVTLQVRSFEEAVIRQSRRPLPYGPTNRASTSRSTIAPSTAFRSTAGSSWISWRSCQACRTRPSSPIRDSTSTVLGERSITNSFLVDGMHNRTTCQPRFQGVLHPGRDPGIQRRRSPAFRPSSAWPRGPSTNIITRSGTNDFNGRGFLFCATTRSTRPTSNGRNRRR